VNEAAGRRGWGFPAALLGIGVLFTCRIWGGSGILYSRWSDILSEHVGIKSILQRSIFDEGRFPLWNPSMNCGLPAFANPQAMLLFPFDLLYLVLPLERATNLVVVLNVLLAGLSFYLLGRALLRHRVSAFVGAAGYMLSWRYLAMIHAGWLPKLSMYALAPLMLWAFGQVLQREDFRSVLLFALVVLLGLLQGDLQQLYYTGLGCVAYGALVLRGLPPPARRGAAARACVAGLCGVLLAAPVLLPQLEYVLLSTRTESSYGFFLHTPLGPSALGTLLDPRDAGGERAEYLEHNFYVGLWLLPLALAALLRSPRAAALPLLAGAVPLVLALDTPLLRLLYEGLPGFSLFRIPSRLVSLTLIAWTLLAARGVDALLGPRPGARALRLAALLVLLPLLDSGVRMLPRLRTLPLEQALPAHAFHQSLRRAPESGRSVAIGRGAIPYASAAYYGIDLANGNASINVRAFMDYFWLLKVGEPGRIPAGPKIWTDLDQVARPDLLAALDVRHVVANEPFDLGPMGYEPLAAYEDVPIFRLYHGLMRVPIHVWRLREPPGAAYFASSVHPVADDSASLAAVARSSSIRQAFVRGYPGKPGWLDASGSARLLRRGFNEYAYEVESASGGFLILAQVWYPGWKASIAGRPVPLYRTNHALLGAEVPAGGHTLELSMTSPRLTQGLGLCLVGAALLGLISRRFGRRPEARS
jgi:hypothetical protein